MSDGRITLYVAASVDGFIADSEGGVEWLDEYDPDPETDGDPYGYEAFVSDVDCVVVGSRTYEQQLTFGGWPYGDRPTYVLTRRELPRATDAVESFDGEVDDLIPELRRRYDHVFLVGGATVARAFLRHRGVDELRLFVVPVLLGSGVALFGDDGERRRLRQLNTVAYDSGIVELRYEATD